MRAVISPPIMGSISLVQCALAQWPGHVSALVSLACWGWEEGARQDPLLPGAMYNRTKSEHTFRKQTFHLLSKSIIVPKNAVGDRFLLPKVCLTNAPSDLLKK